MFTDSCIKKLNLKLHSCDIDDRDLIVLMSIFQKNQIMNEFHIDLSNNNIAFEPGLVKKSSFYKGPEELQK